MHHFVPAGFELYEFACAEADEFGTDAGAGKRTTGPSATRKRWFSHWDGLIGAPAEEVALGWSAGGSLAHSRVIVCASGRRAYGVDPRNGFPLSALNG